MASAAISAGQRSETGVPAMATHPDLRPAGIAGLLAGVGLLGEFVLFGMTGLGQTTLDQAATALPFLRDQGDTLRAAVLVGAANNVLVVLLYWGLATRVRIHAPTLAAAGLLLGLVAVGADGLVALSYWRAPAFVDLATAEPAIAPPAWQAFQAVVSAARDVANVFVGSALIAFGIAGIWKRALSRPLSVAALLTGIGAVAGPLGIGAAYLVSLVLAIVFRFWAGIELFRTGASPAGEEAA
jgi:hypothetical protein